MPQLKIGDTVVPNDKEYVLEDGYPVFPGYLYIADGKIIESPFKGEVVGLKRFFRAKEIRRFDFSRV